MPAVNTGTLRIGYEQWGSEDDPVVVLVHGFPDGARAWNAVAGQLTRAGWRVVAPYLRGFGPTRFRDPGQPRTAQQAALAADLLDFLDAAGLDPVLVGGQDWGALAAQGAAVLKPHRIPAWQAWETTYSTTRPTPRPRLLRS